MFDWSPLIPSGRLRSSLPAILGLFLNPKLPHLVLTSTAADSTRNYLLTTIFLSASTATLSIAPHASSPSLFNRPETAGA